MTPSEERQYLSELCLEAARWRVDHDDPCCALELEVRDRLRRLNGIETVDENGEVQGEVEVSPVITEDDYKTLEAAKMNEHLASPQKVEKAKEKWKQGRVRCQENGKPVWRLMSECHREMLFPNNPTAKKFRWVWDGPQDKQEQCDAMWAEHEQGNKEN